MFGPEQSAHLELLGVVDRTEKRARISVTVSGDASSEATTYIVNDTAYVKSRNLWRKRDVSDRNLWDRNAQLQKQRRIFENAKLEIVGNETVAGERVTVVRIHVPNKKLDELTRLAQQGESSEFNIQDVTYTSYIDVETKNLRKMRVEMTMKRNGNSYDATVVMRFSDFGENVTIEVPDEAKDGIGPTT